MTTNQSFCFASLHGGNHGSDPKNPLQSAPFRNGNIFIGYYDEPNTPFGDNPCLGDILKNSHIEPVHFFKDYHRSLEVTQMRVIVNIDGKPIRYSFRGFNFWLKERRMFCVLGYHGSWGFLENTGRFSTIYSLVKTSCSKGVDSNGLANSSMCRRSPRIASRSSTVISSGGDDEADDEEPILQEATQEALTSQRRNETRNFAAAVRAMLNQAFEMWPWAPESLAVNEIIRQMTVAAAAERLTSMDELRRLNCKLWAQLAFEAIERGA